MFLKEIMQNSENLFQILTSSGINNLELHNRWTHTSDEAPGMVAAICWSVQHFDHVWNIATITR